MVLSQVLFLLLLYGTLSCQASYNLYIKAEEQMRIFGIRSDLYYVREGVLNQYALNFVVPLPKEVTSIHFTWAALEQKPLPYTINVDVSDRIAMDSPGLNISWTGYIPIQPETFRVSFPCTGVRDAEVLIQLTVNVSNPSAAKHKAKTPSLNTDTPLVIKRHKVCYAGADPQHKLKQGTPAASSRATSSSAPTPAKPKSIKNLKSPKDTKEEPSIMVPTTIEADNGKIIYIIVASLFGLLLILVALASALYVRSRKGSLGRGSNGFLHIDTTSGNCSSSGSGGSRTGTGTRTACSGSGSGLASIFIRPESPAHHYSSVSPCPTSNSYTYSSFQPSYGLYTEIQQSNLIKNADTNSCKMSEMAIQRCKVRLQSVIMEGTFAKVYKGTVLEKDGSEEKAIIKTVHDHSSPVQMALLLHEGLALVGLDHKHVYTVVGVAAEERVPPFVIYPDEGFRNLKKFLQRSRSGPGRPITAQEILHMAIQIGTGLAFLHRQNLFHRDVAARNCVIDDKLMVKISDSALSKDLFPEDYHWMGDSESRPIKWMPPEAIMSVCYRVSMSVDMWSFGVLLWELATLAQQPYAEMDPNQLVSFYREGYRLSQPVNCPAELYSSMTRCWEYDPDDRPKWTYILPELQSLHAQLAQYV